MNFYMKIFWKICFWFLLVKIIGTHCENPCPEGFYGKGCIEYCSCSSQFDCHAELGCVCKHGYSGTDCLTPKGQYQELNNGMIFDTSLECIIK